jgi:hypothetical protein
MLKITQKLLSHGYELSGYFRIFGENYVIRIYRINKKEDSTDLGEMEFKIWHCDSDIDIWGHWYAEKTMRSYYNDRQAHIIHLERHGVFFSSNTPCSEAPPEWLQLCADILERHFHIDYPNWVLENPEARNYVNVVFNR